MRCALYIFILFINVAKLTSVGYIRLAVEKDLRPLIRSLYLYIYKRRQVDFGWIHTFSSRGGLTPSDWKTYSKVSDKFLVWIRVRATFQDHILHVYAYTFCSTYIGAGIIKWTVCNSSWCLVHGKHDITWSFGVRTITAAPKNSNCSTMLQPSPPWIKTRISLRKLFLTTYIIRKQEPAQAIRHWVNNHSLPHKQGCYDMTPLRHWS